VVPIQLEKDLHIGELNIDPIGCFFNLKLECLHYNMLQDNTEISHVDQVLDSNI
jgi:hypothetical protein